MDQPQAFGSLFAQQWRLARIQLVNWGTFCGYHDFPLAENRDDGTAPVIMITGESGTGKSTLFDAKTAVLQRNNVRFNSASNAVGRGRARGGSQRSVYTYVLGKQDDVYDEKTGEEHESFLRTAATPQWSAVVLGFRNTSGAVYSCARFWYLPQGGDEADLKPYLLTIEGDLDPRLLGSALSQPPSRRTFAEVYPGVTTYETVSALLGAVYSTLGIDEGGNGANAMKLHERIQAGYPITDVDALFKELVIDEPTTYDYAEKALASFDEGEGVWRQMDEIRRKIDMLSGIRETYDTYQRQADQVALLESLLGDGADGLEDGTPADPLALLLARRQDQVLDHAADEVQGAEEEQTARLADLDRDLQGQRQELEKLREEVRAKGGDALDRKQRELEEARVDLAARKLARQELTDLLAAVGRQAPGDAPGYAALRAESAALLESRDETARELTERRIAIGVESEQLKAQLKDLQGQLDYYRKNRVRITPPMAEARQAMADALGLEASELPYAAELIDTADGEDRWHLAACIGYHGLAMNVLVDAERLDELSRAIDDLQLRRRVTFTGVDLHQTWKRENRPGHLSSKMKVKRGTPFAAWLWHRLSSPDLDCLCVDGPDQLRGQGRRIDPAGQTREGMRGAHGYDPRSTNIIGFSNDDLIAQVQSQIGEATERLVALQGEDLDVESDQRLLSHRCDVANWVTHRGWEAVDVVTASARVEALVDEVRRLREDDALRRLMDRRDALERAVDDLQQAIGATRQTLRQTQERLERLRTQRETVASRLERAQAAGLVASPPQEQKAREFLARQEKGLSPESGGASWAALADGFDRVCDHVREDARGSLATARQQTTLAGRNLVRAFSTYHDQWLGEEDPTGVGVDSYPDYLRMLEELEANKLNEPRDEWLRTMYMQVGAALVPLADAFSQDLREIRGRMRPINQIMNQFDFGPEHGRLEILIRDRRSALTARLRRELSSYSELATKPEQAMEDTRYHQSLRDFMERLRKELERRERGALNTKGLVSITVRARYPEESGKPDNTFASLDAKSGGETQELIAFILGAALLFCLGRNAQGLPAFSPVFLDEAFIKADEHFTRRAINALQGLGFQIVIAVPTSKVQAVEPVADQYVCVSKNRRGQSFINPLPRG